MGCQPCEERRQRLEQLAADGTPLPARDWAFYVVTAIAVTAVGYIVWRQVRG